MIADEMAGLAQGMAHMLRSMAKGREPSAVAHPARKSHRPNLPPKVRGEATIISQPSVDSKNKTRTTTRDGSWDGKTRRIAVNARLLDDFEAADWPVTVIDGKRLW